MAKLIAAAALAAALVATPVGAEPDAGAPTYPATLATALSHYEHERYADALASLLAAAEDGNASAQVMVGMMYLHGPRFYGAGVPQDLEAARSWLERAARSGSPVAKFFVANLDLMQQRAPRPPDRELLIRPK